MDKFITQLIEELNKLNRLGRLAPEKLSAIGEKNKASGSLPLYQEFWSKVVSESEKRTQEIESLQSNFPDNKLKMSQQLAFYRSLSRYVSECTPSWSAYYQDIDACMDNIYDLLVDIDKKYHLGQHADD